MGQYIMVGGWLAFKMAAKWESWKNIVQVPDNLDGVTPLNWFKAREALGSYMFARFLIGTLLNLLIGLVSAYVGLHFYEFVYWVCSKWCN